MARQADDRIWLADLNAVLDWPTVFKASQARYAPRPLATFWVQATPGVNYYRAELPARHLPGKTVWFDSVDIQPDGYGGHRFPRQEGQAAVWMFPGNTTRALAMAEMKTQHDLRVLVEVDDNYTRQPAMPQLSAWLTTRDRTGQDRHSYDVHRRIVRSICDGVIVSTPRLAQVYESLTEQVYVCRNSVDPDDWDPEPPHAPDGVLRIGWAGSASHGYDVADIRPALDWVARQKDVEVVVLGELVPFGVPVRHIPWTDSLADYRRNVRELDVMLCPLRPSAWADCKSDVKALEAAMGGACSVVSKTEPYRPWWDGEAPGYVAETSKDLIRVVQHLVRHRNETAETARLAREYAVSSRNIRREIKAWQEAIDGC
ncbi:MAG: hypothetical protein HY323_05460 [Betaproteobacteria bacterium]|nr:hypothetical protein [Betaproteobacteria bacterium]